MTREKLIQQIASIYGITATENLMNVLQDSGLVSDNAMTISDVSDGDLMRAYNRSIESANKE